MQLNYSLLLVANLCLSTVQSIEIIKQSSTEAVIVPADAEALAPAEATIIPTEAEAPAQTDLSEFKAKITHIIDLYRDKTKILDNNILLITFEEAKEKEIFLPHFQTTLLILLSSSPIRKVITYKQELKSEEFKQIFQNIILALEEVKRKDILALPFFNSLTYVIFHHEQISRKNIVKDIEIILGEAITTAERKLIPGIGQDIK